MESSAPDGPTLRQPSSPRQENVLGSLPGAKTQLGKYRLVRLLAEGGFASVYLGEHIHLNTLAAIKVLRTSLHDTDWEEFRTEARIVARLRHPHIIRVHDFDVEDGMPFLIMDYASRGNLRQRHPRGSILSPETALLYLKQTGPALQYAHEQRLVHRDMKPENLLIGEDDTVLLSDFGIALIQSTQAQTEHGVVGTLAYMAPEQWQGRPVPASDQYALGIVAYEWLAGHCPFAGSPAELAAQHVQSSPSSFAAQAHISEGLEAAVLRALAKAPEERFSSVIDFVGAFEAALQPSILYLPDPQHEAESPQEHLSFHQDATVQVSLPATPPALPPVQPEPGPRIARRALLAGLTGALVLGAGGGLGWFLTHKPQFHPPRPTPTASPATPTPTPIPIGTTLHTYRGHHDTVNSLASSPDGSRIASASADTTVQVWDTSTGGVNAVSYSGHTAAVNAAAWSSDGKFVVSGSDDMTARVWQTGDGSNPVTYTQHTGAVEAVAWSPDNQSIASGSADKTVQVWSAGDGSSLFTYSGHSDVVQAVAWKPGSSPTRIASGGADTTVQIWDASDGSNAYTYTGHSDVVNALAWSPDGSMIASGSSDKTVRVWQAATGNLVYIYGGHSDVVHAVAWSPDGSRIASASADKTVQIWGASDGSNPYTYQGHNAPVHALAWLLNGQLELASGGEDTTVQIWQAA